MMSKLAIGSLALGGAMALAMAAQAEPMTLDATALDGVTAAGYAYVDGYKNVDINEDIDKHVEIYKDKYIRQYVDVYGFYADADGAANCYGYGCETITYALTDVDATKFMSTSISGSEAAAQPFPFYPDDHGGKPDHGAPPKKVD